MNFFRDLLFQPETLRALLLTLSFVFLAAAFVLRLIRKEEMPQAPLQRFQAQPATPAEPFEPAAEPLIEERQPIIPSQSIVEPPPRVRPYEKHQPAVTLLAIPEPEAVRTSEERETPAAASPAAPVPEAIAASSAIPEVPAVPIQAPERFSFEVLQNRPSVLADLLRGMLAILALIVLVGFMIVALPQPAFDRVADGVRIRKSPLPPQDTIALLYLGEEIKGSEFHIRAVVRNITARPVEQLDANVRLYAPDRTLIESAIVRMDTDLIAPDTTASFNLSYPDYHAQFGSYSIDFKLRQGEPVPYKDLRALRTPE